MHTARPELRVFVLVDFDPDGIAILRNYKYGGRKMAHEENNTVPRARWIGIKSTDVLREIPNLDAAEESSQDAGSQHSNGRSQSSQTSRASKRRRTADAHGTYESILPLTARDRKKATDLLEVICGGADQDAEVQEQKLELQRCLMLNVKAEMQALDNLGDMTSWLDDNLGRA